VKSFIVVLCVIFCGAYKRTEELVSDKADKANESENASVTLPATVQKIIPAFGSEPEKAEIAIEGAEELYREIRVENNLRDPDGSDVKLKKGAEVEVTIEAEPAATIPRDRVVPIKGPTRL
jgi:hypothetical protein